MRFAMLLCVSTGCFASSSPRLAKVEDRGVWTITATQPLGAYETGRANGERRGNTAGALSGWLVMAGGGAGLDVEVSRGVGASCEAGGIVGFERFGAEGRCQILDGAVAIAPFARGGYQFGPFLAPEGPWLAGGFDLSVGRFALSPTLSYEAVLHHVDVPGQGIDEEAAVVIARDEWRASAPVGVAFEWGSESITNRVMIGVSPYITIAHGAPSCASTCDHESDRTIAAGFDQDVGVLFLIGIGPTLR